MKKRYLALVCALATALAGCGKQAAPIPEQNTTGDGATESVSMAEAPAATEDATTESSDSSETLASTEDSTDAVTYSVLQSSHPIYKVITKYYHETYNGKYSKDKEGNSLENKTLFTGKYQALMLTESCRNSYPALFKTLEEKAAASIKASEENASSNALSAKEELEESMETDYPFLGTYYDNNTVSVSRADDSILSVCNYYENYTGGAHGMYGLWGENYDVETGALLNLSDVITMTEEELHPILKEKVLKTAEDPDQFWDLDEAFSHYKYSAKENDPEDYENYEYNYDWYLDNEGIHFYFAPYAIAAYAYGATDVVISYDELKGQINEKYLPAENKGYITEAHLPIYPAQYDDNTSDLHLVYEPYDETDTSDYITCKSLALKLKDKSAQVAIDFDFNYTNNPINSYRVVTADGREYIYVTVLTYSDYTEFLVFDASGKNIKLIGQDYFHMVYVDSNTEYTGELVLTDPENMYFGQIGNKLGTYTCFGRYIVGANGMPMLADTSLTITWISDEIKSVQDISVTRIDEKGYEQDVETLPAGTHVRPIRTDNKTYMDCVLDDGSFVRLKFSSREYPAMIDGISVDDLFEGLQYAG